MRYGPTIIGAIFLSVAVLVFLNGVLRVSSCTDCSNAGSIIDEAYGLIFGTIGAVVLLLGLIGGKSQKGEV